MPDIIITDTSCLITLTNIGELALLNKVYGKIITTQQVAEEYGDNLPNWIQIEEPKNKDFYLSLLSSIGKGESSAIALALEKRNCILILDDHKARKIASKYNLKFIGTLGVLLLCETKGIISSIEPLIDKLNKTSFRVSEKVIEDILKNSKKNKK